MTCYNLIKIKKSIKSEKKYMAIFENCQNGREKITHFGVYIGKSSITLKLSSKLSSISLRVLRNINKLIQIIN